MEGLRRIADPVPVPETKPQKSLRPRRLARLLGWFAVAVATIGVFQVALLRSWYLRWGATEEEVHRRFPGDEFSPHSGSGATRAVTIHAAPGVIWPWIVQLGQDRGGYYSYSWLENLFGCEMRNADRIIPEFQTRQVGDTVWLTPKSKYGGRGRMIVGAYQPTPAMVLVTPLDAERIARGEFVKDGSWGLYLEPLGPGITRLFVRSRGGEGSSILGKLFGCLVFDPAHFIMERKMMLGIKKRAEAGGIPSHQAGSGSESAPEGI